MNIIPYSLLLVALGWLLNSVTGGLWLRVRNQHRFGDVAHLWTSIGGKLCAFTAEQIKVAHDRACRLSQPRRRWLPPTLWVAGLLLLAALAFSGCGRREAQLTTGRVLPASSMSAGIVGDAAYAEVRQEALPALYADFRGTLSRLGLVKWDPRFDCNRFASLYVAVAQTRYAVAAWHSPTDAQALALAEVWYRRQDGTAHAIVQARTPAGDTYIEPQTGLAVPTPTGVFLRKW